MYLSALTARTMSPSLLCMAFCVVGVVGCRGGHRSFADVCRDARLPDDARHAVQVLLAYAGTDDCTDAEQWLSARDTINLTNVAATEEFGLDASGAEPPDEAVMLAKRPLTDLTPMASLPQVRVLMADGNAVTDLAPLAALAGLEVLHLSGSTPGSLAPLAGLTRLRELVLQTDSIEDFGPLPGLNALECLDLTGGGRLEDLGWIDALPSLVSLGLNGHRIRDLRPLRGLTHLERLRLNRNRIQEVDPLATLTTLKHVRLIDNVIEDVTPLAALVNLETLWLEDNQITNVMPLSSLPKLELLVVSGNPLDGGECPLAGRRLGGGRSFSCSY